MIKKEYTIREPKSTFIDIVMVSAALTLQTAFCYHVFSNYVFNAVSITWVLFTGYILVRSIIIPGLRTKCIYLNFSHRKIKYEIEFGPLVIKKKWEDLGNVEYISVFKSKGIFEVNIWNDKNQKKNLFADTDFDEVMSKAFIFVEKFNIDFLDARERGNHRWIDKKIYKTENRIQYID